MNKAIKNKTKVAPAPVEIMRQKRITLVMEELVIMLEMVQIQAMLKIQDNSNIKVIEIDNTIPTYFIINYSLNKVDPTIIPKILCSFIKESFTHDHDSCFVASNHNIVILPQPISSITVAQYPSSKLYHEQFFPHHHGTQCNNITVYYSIVTNLHVTQLKNQLFFKYYLLQHSDNKL